MMKTKWILAAALALALASAGCATKKYVAKTMAPVEARVATAEAKNADQDQKLTAQAQEIGELQAGLSRTNERLSDADAKAASAGQAAQRAQEAASAAQRTADGAMTAATEARTAAINRANEVERNLSQKVDATLKLQLQATETVLFATNQYTLSAEAKAALDAFAQQVRKRGDRYVIEVQGFTDKTGSAEANALLSQRRAESVARYLINEHKIPLHAVNMLGSGYAQPVGDDKTRAGRRQNRRVEVRLFTPEVAALSAAN
jgi:outer membrane protein OmpA-like peptidoglycan-associated protein